jgi:hypothetical protein
MFYLGAEVFESSCHCLPGHWGCKKKAVLHVLHAPAFWPRTAADTGNPFQLQLLHLNNVRPLFSGLLLISPLQSQLA